MLAQLQGLKPGTYARIVISKVPYQFVQNFDPKRPVLIGGLLPGEEARGVLQVRPGDARRAARACA